VVAFAQGRRLYDDGMNERPSSDVEAWYGALEARHLATLTFPEVRRALQALSSLYVERRERLAQGRALEGAGKRAAFAMFYGPLHFLIVREIVAALHAAEPPLLRVVDLGCGTGSAGAAWALQAGRRPAVTAIDASGWAVCEAEWNLRTLGLTATVRRGNLVEAVLGSAGEGIVVAYAANELDEPSRAELLSRLIAAHGRGSRVLVVEPIARRPVPFWPAWVDAFRAAGGRADTWRFPAVLPERMKLLDKAAGLDHRELTARSLWLGSAGR
jgi:SAM-dependent methyltransferase